MLPNAAIGRASGLADSLHTETGDGVGVIVVIFDHAAAVFGLQIAAALLLARDSGALGNFKLSVLLHLESCPVVGRDCKRFGDLNLLRHRNSLSQASACLGRATSVGFIVPKPRRIS